MSSIGLLLVYGNASNDDVFIHKECLKRLIKKRKCYDLKYKLNTIEFAKMNSDEEGAKKLTLR